MRKGYQMEKAKKENAKTRIAITLTTMLCLFLLPYIKLPSNISFLVPGIAEVIAYFVLMLWVEHKDRSAERKSSGAHSKLKSSIHEEIKSIKEEIKTTTDETVLKILNKQLLSLYEERTTESLKERERLRGDIEKYNEEKESYKDEMKNLKDKASKKIESELNKASGEAS